MPEHNGFAPNGLTSASAQASVNAPEGRGGEGSRRSAEREVVSYLGVATLPDGSVSQVDLVDLSAAGGRLIADSAFSPEGEFVLKVPETGAGFIAEVVWQKGATFGVRFLRPSGD